MTLQSQRPVALVLAIALTVSLWLPTVSNASAQGADGVPYVVTTAAPLVLM